MVGVHDIDTQSFHSILVHRLDYRPQSTSPVGNVVVFSEPTFTPDRTETLQLATPAYYRDQEDLTPGIRDPRDGTLTKNADRWASSIFGGTVSVRLSFVSSGEPWVYCASHYRADGELRRLRSDFRVKYGYSAATLIDDPDAFAVWLGVDFALALDKTADVTLGPIDEIGYARSSYTTNLWDGSRPIDTFVHVLPRTGPLRERLRPRRQTGTMVRSERRSEGMVHQENLVQETERIPLRGHDAWRPRTTETLCHGVSGVAEARLCPLSSSEKGTGADVPHGRGTGRGHDRYVHLRAVVHVPHRCDNAPRAPMETDGLNAVAGDPSTPVYGTETLGEVDYFTAVYADLAVARACVTCQNNHVDSPRKDFELNEVMGGIGNCRSESFDRPVHCLRKKPVSSL